METNRASELLATLGHAGRLDVFRLLVRRAPGSVRPSEMTQALGLKANTLSVYLGGLQRAGLVRSERRGKSIHYWVDLPAMGALVDFLVADCCRGRPILCAPLTASLFSPSEASAMSTPYNVLFICSGNSARSIFAEALLRDLGTGRFRAHSAGTRPYSELNPFALEVLQRNGHATDTLRSKNIDEFQTEDAPRMDFVFTVCDAAANEECPPWPGQPITAHWGLPDPVKATGSDAEKGLAFAEAYARMRRRVEAFTALAVEQLDRIALQAHLDEIAEIDEAAADA